MVTHDEIHRRLQGLQGSQFFVLVACLLLSFLLAGCGGGESATSADDARRLLRRPSVDLAAGGMASTPSGAEIEVLPGTGQGQLFFTGALAGAAGAVEPDGVVISASHEIRAHGFSPGRGVAPFVVTLPVDASLLPATVDANAFVAQTFDPVRGVWMDVSGFAAYDAATSRVRFQTGHLSTWRVKYVGLDESMSVKRYIFYTDNFAIHYALPNALGQVSSHFPVENVVWAGKGSGTASDPAVPDYVEDLGRALEQSLTYYLKLSGSAGKLFTSPAVLEHVKVYVMYVPGAAGDTSLPLGYIRIRAQLKDWNELRLAAAHELMHLLQDQYYTNVGAWMNKWFVEATANLMSARAAGLSRAEQVAYYTEGMTSYLQVPLDASEEGSYYAAADFLNWLEAKVAKPVAADVMQRDATWDLTALTSVATSGTGTLGAYFTEYLLGATVGTHDFKSNRLWTTTFVTSASQGWRHEFEQFHLSGHAVEIQTDVAADALLVATSGRNYRPPKLQTFSYLGGAPHADLSSPLEKQTEAGKPVVVKHFGKAGTPGVTSSRFQQVIVNPAASDETVWGNYFFDYYLLVPPELLPLRNGQVAWSYSAQGIPTSANDPTITGFNVYVDGVKLNATLVPAHLREFYDARIWTTSAVQVTVVDKQGNEWPEVVVEQKPPFTGVTEVCASFSYTSITAVTRITGGPYSVVHCVAPSSTPPLLWQSSFFSWRGATTADMEVYLEGNYIESSDDQQITNVRARRPLSGRYAQTPPPLEIRFFNAPRDKTTSLIRFKLNGAAAEGGRAIIQYQPEDDCSGGFCEARRVDQILPNSVTVWLTATNY